jgi:hypothetical protein
MILELAVRNHIVQYEKESNFDIQCEIQLRHTVHLQIADINHQGRQKPRAVDSGPSVKPSSVGLLKNFILSGRSINIIKIRRCLFRFESSCMVVLPLRYGVTRMPD